VEKASPDRQQRPWRLFVIIASVVSIGAVHGPLIGYKTFANVDEAYAAALAERLLEGHKLYDGAVSQRGPLMYYSFKAFAWLCGWDNIVALRLWALALAFAHLGLVYWLGRRLLSKTAATVATVITAYALAFGYPPEDAIAINGEPLQLPALILAVGLGWMAIRAHPRSSRRALLLAATGLLFGVAISIKQSVALHPLPVVLFLAIDAHRRREPWTRVAKDAALLLSTTCIVPALFVLNAAASGTLKQFYYYTIVYNRDVHLHPTTKHFEWLPTLFFRLTGETFFFMGVVLLLGFAIPFLVGRVRAASRLRSGWALVRAEGATSYLAYHFVLAFFGATVMYRFFPHYYLQAAPFMALVAASVVDRYFRRPRTARSARVIVSTFTLFVVFASALGCVFGEKVDGRVSHDRTHTDAAKYIMATTEPSDRIFVWGFSPWLYEYAHRRPAGRYVFSTYVTGFVPWYWEKLSVEKARIVPGSVEALLGDLAREKPAIVVDAGSVMMARPMRLYDAPTAWLYEHYCFEVRFGALDVYRRKPDGGRCAYPWFPRSAPVVDWLGRSMGIPLPLTLDYANAAELPIGNYLKPIWFTRGPKPRGLEAVRDRRREKEEAEGAAEGFFVSDVQPETEPRPPPPYILAR
jgi:4-amino-4-deoxy-L-arabinose transferase-like glycosyltransferase